MKTLPSSIMKEGKPVSKERAFALSFIERNKAQISEFINIKKRDLAENARKIEIQKARNPIQEAKLYFVSAGAYALAAVLMLFLKNESLSINKYLAFFILALGSGGIFAFIFLYRIKLIQKDIADKIAELELERKKIEERKPSQILSHIGTVGFLASFQNFESEQILLDKAGVIRKKEFIFPDIPVAENFEKIKNYIENIKKDLPIVVVNEPNLKLSKEVKLLGVESDIREALFTIRNLIDNRSELKVSLPLFVKPSDVVRSINILSEHFIEEKQEKLVFKKDIEVQKSLKTLSEINDNTREAKAKGSESDEDFLQTSVQYLQQRVGEVNETRAFSIKHILGEGIERLYPLLDYPLTTFYCPECLKIPKYLEHKHKLNKNVLDMKESEFKQWKNSDILIKLKRAADARKNYLESLKLFGQENSEEIETIKAELKLIEDRIIHLIRLAEYTEPEAEATRHNAVLKYNIVNKNWKCELCNTTFSEEEARFGRILKVKDQLFYPIWDNLWMEKQDEHNRILRDKEAEIRANKDLESTQIRAEADVFTKEYRAARSQLDEATSLYEASADEFNSVVNFLVTMEILTPNKIQMITEKLFKENQTMSPNVIISRADAMELALEQEAEVAFLRRNELQDYTLALRDNDKFYEPIIWKEFPSLIPQNTTKALEDKHE